MERLLNINLKDILGAEIVYDDPGVWGYSPRCQRKAVIVGMVSSRIYGLYLIVRAEGINVEKRITPEQVVSYVWATEKASA